MPQTDISVSHCIPSFGGVYHLCIPTVKSVYHMCVPPSCLLCGGFLGSRCWIALDLRFVWTSLQAKNALLH